MTFRYPAVAAVLTVLGLVAEHAALAQPIAPPRRPTFNSYGSLFAPGGYYGYGYGPGGFGYGSGWGGGWGGWGGGFGALMGGLSCARKLSMLSPPPLARCGGRDGKSGVER